MDNEREIPLSLLGWEKNETTAGFRVFGFGVQGSRMSFVGIIVILLHP